MKINVQIIRKEKPVFARVKSSYEKYGVSRLTFAGSAYRSGQRAGIPDTWQYKGTNNAENGFIWLTEEIQWFWYNACKARVPSTTTKLQLDGWFNGLTKGNLYITNNAGSDTRRVYPTGENDGAEDMKYQTLLTSSFDKLYSKIKILGGDQRGYTPFQAINANKPVEQYNPQEYPWLWYVPYDSVRSPIYDSAGRFTGKYTENIMEPFPQYNNRVIAPILMPQTGVAWIDSSLLVY